LDESISRRPVSNVAGVHAAAGSARELECLDAVLQQWSRRFPRSIIYRIVVTRILVVTSAPRATIPPSEPRSSIYS
jgi:hypothetical protein